MQTKIEKCLSKLSAGEITKADAIRVLRSGLTINDRASKKLEKQAKASDATTARLDEKLKTSLDVRMIWLRAISDVENA